jgi:hypothetical protein
MIHLDGAVGSVCDLKMMICISMEKAFNSYWLCGAKGRAGGSFSTYGGRPYSEVCIPMGRTLWLTLGISVTCRHHGVWASK